MVLEPAVVLVTPNFGASSAILNTTPAASSTAASLSFESSTVSGTPADRQRRRRHARRTHLGQALLKGRGLRTGLESKAAKPVGTGTFSAGKWFA